MSSAVASAAQTLSWTEPRDHWYAVLASTIGWTLDSFDYFVVVMVLTEIAQEFHRTNAEVALTITLTLAFRPVGAFLFGLMADKYGRRIPLMIDVVAFSVLSVASGLAPNFTTFLVLRALFGIAMGGEWGAGASLVMEKVSPKWRGLLSGVLQQGAAVMTMIANLGALAGGILVAMTSDRIGRRRSIACGLGIAILVIPLWVFSPTTAMLAVGAFFIQFGVHGAWGVVPAHISELVPDQIRGFMPGFAYQCGILLAGSIT